MTQGTPDWAPAEVRHTPSIAWPRWLSQIDAAMAQAEQALKTANPALAAQTWYNLGNAFFDAE
jgi:hypothetical protein